MIFQMICAISLKLPPPALLVYQSMQSQTCKPHRSSKLSVIPLWSILLVPSPLASSVFLLFLGRGGSSSGSSSTEFSCERKSRSKAAYVVKTTTLLRKRSGNVVFVPLYVHTSMPPSMLSASSSLHCERQVGGATMSVAPFAGLARSNARIWRVFPIPISSARIPPQTVEAGASRSRSQERPSFWKGCSCFRSFFGAARGVNLTSKTWLSGSSSQIVDVGCSKACNSSPCLFCPRATKPTMWSSMYSSSLIPRWAICWRISNSFMAPEHEQAHIKDLCTGNTIDVKMQNAWKDTLRIIARGSVRRPEAT